MRLRFCPNIFAVISIDRFRPNIVVAGRRLAPFAEDEWSRLSIIDAPKQRGAQPSDPSVAMQLASAAVSPLSLSALAPCEFAVEGPCTRCIMVNIDQRTGARRSLLFKTLATHRRGRHQRAARSAAAFKSAVAPPSESAAVVVVGVESESNQSSAFPAVSATAAAAPSGRITFGALLAMRPSKSSSAVGGADALRVLRVGDAVIPSID